MRRGDGLGRPDPRNDGAQEAEDCAEPHAGEIDRSLSASASSVTSMG